MTALALVPDRGDSLSADVDVSVAASERAYAEWKAAADARAQFERRDRPSHVKGLTEYEWDHELNRARTALRGSRMRAFVDLDLARRHLGPREHGAFKDRLMVLGAEPDEVVPFPDQATADHFQRYEEEAWQTLMDEYDQAPPEPEPSIWEHPRVHRGGQFVYEVPEAVAAIWGAGDEVLWAQGEATMIAGPTGTGKSTLAAQVLAGRLGVLDTVLGLPVAPAEHRLGYFALDRPTQLQRLLHRLLSRYDARDRLDEQLAIWRGPLPVDVNTDPEVLVRVALDLEVGEIYIDSAKDAAVKLTDDQAGGNMNRAIQLCLAEGIEVLVLHHQRKAPADAGKAPKTIDDIYGSALIPAGMGSVIGLGGAPGDPIVEFVHLKQPMEAVGPFRVEHDATTGLSSIVRGFDVFRYVQHSAAGVTVVETARQMFETQTPNQNQQAKARRALDALARRMPDQVQRFEPEAGGAGGQKPVRWVLIDTAHEVDGAASRAATQEVAA